MSVHADDDTKIAKDAFRWMVGAGAFALALSLFLALSDYGLSHSDREKRLGDTLRELRKAQAQMPSRVVDGRQLDSPGDAKPDFIPPAK